MSVTVLTAITGTWESSLVAGLDRAPGDVRVARRCVDLSELLSAAAAGLGRRWGLSIRIREPGHWCGGEAGACSSESCTCRLAASSSNSSAGRFSTVMAPLGQWPRP